MELPPVSDALEGVGICPIKEYIQIRQATIVAQVAYRPIYWMCTGDERMPVSSRMVGWCDQDVGCEEE